VSRCSWVSRPLATERSRDPASRRTADSAFSGVRAAITTSKPAFAKTSAIPAAIVPEPATPTVRTVRPATRALSRPGVSASGTTTGLAGAS
jgi:hypothetical protein